MNFNEGTRFLIARLPQFLFSALSHSSPLPRHCVQCALLYRIATILRLVAILYRITPARSPTLARNPTDRWSTWRAVSAKEHVPSTNPPEGTREGKLASTYYSRRHYPEDIPVVSRFPTFETYETEYRFSAVRITLPIYSQAYGANFCSRGRPRSGKFPQV